MAKLGAVFVSEPVVDEEDEQIVPETYVDVVARASHVLPWVRYQVQLQIGNQSEWGGGELDKCAHDLFNNTKFQSLTG